MKAWWLSKSQQEQMALVIGAAVLLLLLLYLMAWQPFTEALERNQQLVKGQQATLSWMEAQLPEIRRLSRSQTRSGRGASNEALLTLVDRTAKQRQLRQQIQRIKPQGDKSVQLWMEQADFDALMKWLGELTEQHGIEIDSLSVDRQELPGLVNARLVLQRDGGA
jgi:general secretion pathway protein M